MKISNTHPSTPATQCDGPTPEEILEFTKQMIGSIAPYLCFGVAQHKAWLTAVIVGATPDLQRCIRMAERHLKDTDPTAEAAAVIHAGMLHVAALKAGIHPGDVGVIVEQAVSMLLPAVPPKNEPEY